MIHLKSRQEIELIRKSALIVSKTLGLIAKEIKPGVTSLYLDNLAEDYIRSQGAIPGFKGLYDFPNTLCVSPNYEVVHGIPNDSPLKSGDIVSIDCGVILNGYFGDHAYTFEVGEVDDEIKKLLETSKKSLYEGIIVFKKGNRLGDVGYAIQHYCEAKGYGVVRELVGHGLGKELHEEPQVPNYGRKGVGKKLQDGMVLAIEPMINLGTHKINQLSDGWTIQTKDKLVSAHFEHNVAMIEGKAELLSTFKYIYQALGIDINSDNEDRFRKTELVI